jgi:hypothetical protein
MPDRRRSGRPAAPPCTGVNGIFLDASHASVHPGASTGAALEDRLLEGCLMRLSGRLIVAIPCLLFVLATIGAPHFAALDRAAADLFRSPDDGAAMTAPVRADSTASASAGQDPVATRFRAAEPTAEPFRPVDDVEHVSVAIVREGRGAVLTSLYASFIGLQALDLHSTRLAIDRGATERNPIMAPFAGNTAAMVGVKVGISAGILYMTERVRVRNRAAAMVMMAAFNSAYATVVANNYRIAARAR